VGGLGGAYSTQQAQIVSSHGVRQHPPFYLAIKRPILPYSPPSKKNGGLGAKTLWVYNFSAESAYLNGNKNVYKHYSNTQIYKTKWLKNLTKENSV